MKQFILLIIFLLIVGCGKGPSSSDPGSRPAAAPTTVQHTPSKEDPHATPLDAELRIESGTQNGIAAVGAKIHVAGSFRVGDSSKPEPRLIGRIVRTGDGGDVIEDSRAVEQKRDGDVVTYDVSLRAPKEPGRYRLDVVGDYDSIVAASELTVAN
jgi:hypothetical protein